MRLPFDTETAKALSLLWDYMQLHEVPGKASCIVGLGCYNTDIAKHAAKLYFDGYAPKILFSGGLGRNTKQMWRDSEAQRFADIALSLGVPPQDILLEDKSANTAENILFTKALLAAHGIKADKLLVIHKPYMQRRVKAAWGVYWPDCSITLTSYPQTMEDYFAHPGGTDHPPAFTANMMVGDFQRILIYPEKGYQLPQEVPEEVMASYSYLVSQGFTEQMIV